jgi:AraC-like DNA-binding protein
MLFLQAQPAEPLKKYIHQYWFMSTDNPAEFGNLRQMMFPIDFGGLAFYFTSELPLIEHYKNNIRRRMKLLYTGLITSPGSITFHPDVPISGFVVAFLPHGFSDLFRFDVSTITDQLPDFRCLFNDEGEFLYREMEAAADFEAMVDIANTFFLSTLPEVDNSQQMIDSIDKIVESNGLIDVKQLAQDVNMSVKTLERHFRTRIGVSPKMYARFKRFHYALKLLNDPAHKSWFEIAHECGYYDQAHFIKEFRRFTNQNPSAFSVMDYPLFYRFIIEKK